MKMQEKKAKKKDRKKMKSKKSNSSVKKVKTSRYVKVARKLPPTVYFPYGIQRHNDLKWHTRRFKKLIDHLEDAEREVINQAYAFAKGRHAKLIRCDGSLYIIHPVRIANIVMEEWGMYNTSLVAASLLHDVVEDTQTTIKEVKDSFGDEVGKLVDGITMWKGSETPELYLKRVSRGSEQLRLMKCADTLDNLRSWHECGEEIADKFPRWWRQTDEYVIPMAHETYELAAAQIQDILNNAWYLKRANMM